MARGDNDNYIERSPDPEDDDDLDYRDSRKTARKEKQVHDKRSQGGGYAWEEEYTRTWDVVREDQSGSLEAAVQGWLEQGRRKRILRDTTSIQRGIIRHLYLVLDLSQAMTDRDLRPTRLQLTLRYAQEFVSEFFDQNPISQMAITLMKDGISQRLTNLSGNPVEHLNALKNKSKFEPSGEPSLQNSLEMARAGLAHLPTHGSREVLVVFGSLTSCDPGNIHKTLDALEKDRVRVSIVGLAAEMSICREICKKTKGSYGIAVNEDHFKDLLFECVPPPAAHKAKKGAGVGGTTSDIMEMGFPTLISASNPTLCACHSKLTTTGFICPRCNSKLCEVPMECVVCMLTVVSSPHLARSYRHLFPVPNWLEVNGPIASIEAAGQKACWGCNAPFPTNIPNSSAMDPHRSTNTSRLSQTGRYECPRCHRHFCLDCDVYVHESLGVCPGCEA